MIRKWLPFVALGAFMALVAWGLRQAQQAQRRGRYTVGYVTGWMPTLKNGLDITYRCLILGVPYTGSDHELPHMNSTRGTRYVVVFDSTNPGNNWAYYDMPVPDSAVLPPPAGWRKSVFDQRQAVWRRADSLRQVRLEEQQDSLQLLRWQQAHQQ